METTPAELFARIIELAASVFGQVEYSTDYTPSRAILRLEGLYRDCHIFVVELLIDATRKYSYYVLRGEWVEVGFDNSPDPRAIRLKYGKIGEGHAGELVPHQHRANKAKLVLTQEMTFEMFVEWLYANLSTARNA